METKTENRNQSLTKAELHLMNILWDKGNATVQQIQDLLEEPKPAYTTTLTVMQVLTRKGIVALVHHGHIDRIQFFARCPHLAFL